MKDAYYNENDPYAAQWLRNLIAARLITPGDVDERDIRKVDPINLTGYAQYHFFAGIGGWAYALRLAGLDTDDFECWTGSCPCQPFSAMGQRKGTSDARHLWPAFRILINVQRPPIVFGEQVASKAGRTWLAGIRADLENMDYAVGAADLCAASVGAPHNRPRLYWVAHSNVPCENGWVAPSREQQIRDQDAIHNRWEIEPCVRALENGVSRRMDKIRGAGNAIVPQVAAEFVRAYLDCRPVR